MNNFSKIAHTNIDICSPVPWESYEPILRQSFTSQNPTILDIGCGKCGLLSKVVSMTNGIGYGVDLPGSLASELSAEAKKLIATEKIYLILQDASNYIKDYQNEKFDIIMCVGSSHAIGGSAEGIKLMKSVLKPGGLLIWGELVWQKKPSPEFLDFLGCKESDQPYAKDVYHLLQESGVQVVHSFSCKPLDFENYESAFRDAVLSWCEQNLDDPDSTAFRKRINSWSHARNKWAREEFGFEVFFSK